MPTRMITSRGVKATGRSNPREVRARFGRTGRHEGAEKQDAHARWAFFPPIGLRESAQAGNLRVGSMPGEHQQGHSHGAGDQQEERCDAANDLHDLLLSGKGFAGKTGLARDKDYRPGLRKA
jgi:hypothetical protein